MLRCIYTKTSARATKLWGKIIEFIVKCCSTRRLPKHSITDAVSNPCQHRAIHNKKICINKQQNRYITHKNDKYIKLHTVNC